jgi:hypothetical protein
VAQQRHIVDRVRSGDHPRDQGGDFQSRVRAEVSWQVEMLLGQLAETRRRRNRHHRDEASSRHEIRVIEGR